MTDTSDYGPTLLRLVLGLLFILPGINKLMGMLGGGHMIVGMVGGSVLVAWLVLLGEILGGLAVLAGWQLKYTVWPLVLIMLGAIFIAVIPSMATDPMAMVTLFFHLLAVAGLVSLFLTGPGAIAVDKS